MNTLTEIFDWLLAASLRASLLAIATLFIQAALRRHLGARMRYALWLPVLIVLLMPVLPQSQWSIEHVFQTPHPPAQIIPAPIEPAMELTPVVFEAAAPLSAPINWQRLLPLAWICVSAGMLIVGCISFMLTLHRFKQGRHPASDELLATLSQIAREMRLRHVPRVLISPAVSSPAVTGLLRPTLLLPAEFDREFTPAEARLVLKHELMHLKRGDLPLNAILCVLMALHWFNPLLWIAFFKIRADREAACDAQVLRDAPNAHRIEYGHALLKVETAFCPRGFSLGFVGIFQRGAALRSRIQSIATHRAPHPAMKAVVTLCIVLMTFLGSTRAAPDGSEASLISIEARFIELTLPADQPTTADNVLAEALSEITEIQSHEGPVKFLLNDTQNQTLIRKLSQRKGTDLLATPTVTVRSGQKASVEITREFAMPPDQKPSGQKVGVMLDVLPTLTDKNSLELAMTPRVVEFEGFVKAENGEQKPTFSERKADTRTQMKTGQTALLDLGSKNDSQTIEDHVDGKVVISTKHYTRRVFVFVTARLVDNTAGNSTKPAPTTDTLQARLEKIIIPHMQFQGATVAECIEYLRVQSRDLDTTTTDPTARGVNILYKASNPPSNAAITLDLKEIPLGEALRYIVELASLKMSIQPNAVVIAQSLPATGAESLEPAIPPPSSKILFPNLEFRDATLAECIDFIRIKSRELDPDKKGVNIIVKPGGDASAHITLSLTNVPVSEALLYCAELANHKLTSDAQSYFLTPVSKAAPADKDQASSPAASIAEAKAADLRKARPQQYDFSKAKLGDVLRFLATDAGIDFISLPDDNPINQRLITFNIRSSPFEVLETLCRTNGLMVKLDHERWLIRPSNDSELIVQSYALPQTRASVETILDDINSILGGDKPKPDTGDTKPSVTFKKEENSVYVKGTRMQHSWVDGYFKGLNGSARSANAK